MTRLSVKVATGFAIVLTIAAVASLARGGATNTVRVERAWMRPPLGNAQVAAGYATLINEGTAADRLIAVSTDIAETTEMHTSGMEDGVMRMRKLEAIVLPPGETVSFAPGGLHLMFIGTTRPVAPGDTVSATFTFERAGDIAVEMTAQMAPPAP